MTDYHLKISSYAGILAWAAHYRGRVEGPHPRPCHGNSTTYSQGKNTCTECKAELPKRVDWEVEEPWTEARYEKYAASGFEDDSPTQFTDQTVLIETAIKRFTGELEHQWWEDEPVRGAPGDRLILGSGLIDPEDVDEDTPGPEGTSYHWGQVLAEIPVTS